MLKHKNYDVFDYRAKFDTFVGGEANFKTDFTVKIISYEDMTAFVVASEREKTTSVLDTKTGKIETSIPVFDTIYYCYVTRNDLDYGLKFDSLDTLKGSRYEMSNFYEVINIGELNRKTISMDGDSLVYSEKKNGKISIEYLVLSKYDYPDSIFRYYDERLKRVHFSISPDLDKSRNSKLVKVKLVFNKKVENGVSKNRGEILWEIKKGKFKDIDKIKKLFEVFKRDLVKGSEINTRKDN